MSATIDLHPDLSPAPGRVPFDLGGGWTAVILHPIAGIDLAVVGLFLEGELVEVLDEDDEVHSYVQALASRCGATAARRALPA